MSKQLLSSVNDGRLSPSDELANRRKIRLIQVRQQEQEIAKKVRKQVKQQKRNVLQDVAQKLNREFDKKKNLNYAISKEKYVEGLQDFGKAHENATSDVADQALIAAIFDQQKRDAHKRYTEAIQRAQMLKAIEEESERSVMERKMLVKKKEAIRAKQIAMLPKKEVTKENESSGCHTETTIISNRTQSALVERSYAQETNAKDAATDEESRCAELDKDRVCDHSAQMERAQLRHLAALQKARMTKEYTKLESDVKVLQRKAAFTKRNHFSAFPNQGISKNFDSATQAELLDTLGIPQAWEVDFSKDKETDEEEMEQTSPSSSELVPASAEESGTSETEETTATSTNHSESESSDYTSGLATSESEESETRITFVPGRGLPSYQIPSRQTYETHVDTEHLKGETVKKSDAHKKKKAVAFELPGDSDDDILVLKSKIPMSSHDDDNHPEGSDEPTKPLTVETSRPFEPIEDEPVKDVEEKDLTNLEQSEDHPATDPTPPVSQPTYSHANITKALQHPDVLAFQRRILETHGLSGSERSADSSVQDAEVKSESSESKSSETTVDSSDSTQQQISSVSNDTTADESVISLEDGLEKIALGIEKREEELKRQQNILEEYKRKLIAQQKQHVAIAKLSATVGRHLNKLPVSPEMQTVVDNDNDVSGNTNDSEGMQVINVNEKHTSDSTVPAQRIYLDGSNVQIPSLLMMTDPNLKLPTPLSSFSSHDSLSNAAVADDDSGTLEVHEISSSSMRAPSSTSKVSSVSKMPSTPLSNQEGFSFVELMPQADVQLADTTNSSSSYSFDTHQFMELQPDMTTPAKVAPYDPHFNPNVSSFMELTPQTPEIAVKDITTKESPSDLDISEHPLSTHDSDEMSYPPLSSLEGNGSILIRSPTESRTEETGVTLNETSWKSLLAQNDTTTDSSASVEESSVETMRLEDTMIELSGRGILEEPDMTLVSLNSTIPDSGPILNSSLTSQEIVEIFNPPLNKSAIVKEKIPTPDSSISDKSVSSLDVTVLPAQPAASDECLAMLFAYLKKIDTTQ